MQQRLLIQPGPPLEGNLQVPPSKSHSHRALIFGAMGSGPAVIKNLLHSSDTTDMMNALRRLGARITSSASETKIIGLNGKIDGAEDVLDIGNSGIALRFLTALAALSSKPIVITGDASIRSQRSMRESIDALSRLGVSAISTRSNGYAPLIIQGPVQHNRTTVLGADSQHVSALLLLSVFSHFPFQIHVQSPGERPWVDLTLHWLDLIGARYARDGHSFFKAEGNHRYDNFTYTVPGDFSTAAFPLAGAAVTGGSITLTGLDCYDPQGDKKILAILEEMGMGIEHNPQTAQIRAYHKSQLKGIEVDINDCIDAVTILAVLGCFAEGKTVLRNGKTAKTKECDRILCTAKELGKMGAKIIPVEDGLIIEGAPLQGADVDSHNDHRLAMSLAIAGLGAKGNTRIYNTNCTAKTYPDFAQQLNALGAMISYA